MSVLSERLAAVRKEKNIAQKVAASDLGVSQALLSHYEKGIRECSPGFLAKAAEYYGVSSDYLLGLAQAPESDGFLSDGEQPSDKEMSRQTVYRAMRKLAQAASEISPACEAEVLTIYQHSFYEILKEVVPGEAHLKKENIELYLTVSRQAELNKLRSAIKNTAVIPEACPLCVKTVAKHSEELIRGNVNQLKAD